MGLLWVSQQHLRQMAQAEKQFFPRCAACINGLLQSLLQMLIHLPIDAREHVCLIFIVHIGRAGTDAGPFGQLVKGQRRKTLLHSDLKDGLRYFFSFCRINRSHAFDNKRLFTYCQDIFRRIIA